MNTERYHLLLEFKNGRTKLVEFILCTEISTLGTCLYKNERVYVTDNFGRMTWPSESNRDVKKVTVLTDDELINERFLQEI